MLCSQRLHLLIDGILYSLFSVRLLCPSTNLSFNDTYLIFISLLFYSFRNQLSFKIKFTLLRLTTLFQEVADPFAALIRNVVAAIHTTAYSAVLHVHVDGIFVG